MKLRHSLSIFGLVAMLGLGVGVGLASAKQEVREAKADYSGTVKLYLHSDWRYNCHIAIYFWNGDGSSNGWSDYVSASDVTSIDVPYSGLSFEPVNMKIMRYDNAYLESSWEADKWNTSVWNQSGDLAYNSWAVGGGASWMVSSYPTVWSSADEWAAAKCSLDSIKLNGSNNWEFYSNQVNLTKGEQFKVVFDGSWYGYFNEASEFNFDHDNSADKGGNITCNVEGTSRYALYWDTNTKYLYVTDPVSAEADEWAQKFLGITDENNNCSYAKTNWGDLDDDYTNNVSADVKALFYEATHYDHTITDDKIISTYLLKAVQRYDYVLERYGVNAANTDALGYTDFMDRVGAGQVTPKSSTATSVAELKTSSSNNTLIIAIVASSVATLAVIGGYFYFRKRKEDR